MGVFVLSRPMVIVGASDITEDYKTSTKDSLQLAVNAVLKAIESTGKSPDILKKADGVIVVPPNVYPMEYSIGVAQGLNLNCKLYSNINNGGSSPVEGLNLAARLIGYGKYDFIILCGGDNNGSRRRTTFDLYLTAIRLMLNSLYTKKETDHGLNMPPPTYALYGIADAAKNNTSINDLKTMYSQMIAGFSEVAFNYPPAQQKNIISAEEVANARLISHPFTKYMCANPRLDQGNAVLLMSEETAKSFGINEDRWVYFHGGGDYSDHKSAVNEKDFTSFGAAKMAIVQTLVDANIEPSSDAISEHIHHFDIYSCFPSVVKYVAEVLGLGFKDFKRLTLTGGLPRRGGAGSMYSMSALAAMYSHIIKNGGTGFVYAIGGASSAHSACVVGKQPKQERNNKEKLLQKWQKIESEFNKIPPVVVENNPNGENTKIVTYTVVFENRLRGEKIEPYAVCIGEIDGRRFISALEGIKTDELIKMNPSEIVGKTGKVTTDAKGISTLYI